MTRTIRVYSTEFKAKAVIWLFYAFIKLTSVFINQIDKNINFSLSLIITDILHPIYTGIDNEVLIRS